MRPAFSLVLAPLFLAACARGGEAAPLEVPSARTPHETSTSPKEASTPPAPPDAPASPTQSLLEAVARLHGVPAPSVSTEVLDDATFRNRWRRYSRDTVGEGFWTAFTMAPTDDEGGRALNAAADPEGFYDPVAKHIVVRAGADAHVREIVAGTGREAAARKVLVDAGSGSGGPTLAHEIEHAVQDARFGLRSFASFPDADARLASRAVIEGDATLTATTVQMRQMGVTENVIAAAMARHVLDAEIARLRVTAPDAPPLAVKLADWPYIDGAAFVATLRLAGGWALVDAALASPPRTTEQVLHVEKFLAGEQPIPVALPATPPGHSLRSSGVMGELATRVFLAQCVDDDTAAQAASGWGGDAYVIAEAGGHDGLLWVTAWDDEASAERFERALAARSSCPRSGGKPPYAFRRERTSVAFVQGFRGNAERSTLLAPLFALIGAPVLPSPPRAKARFPLDAPPIQTDFEGKGAIEGSDYVAREVGIRSRLEGLTLQKKEHFELVARGRDAAVSIAVSWTRPDSFEPIWLKASQATGAMNGGPSKVALSWGEGEVISLHLPDGTYVRRTLVPACSGRMAVSLDQTWRGDGFALVDQWLRGMSGSDIDGSPACKALDALERR
jgi:hypothetical protein